MLGSIGRKKEKGEKYMFTREKKLIALLLTAALAFTMNTSMFAAVGAEAPVESAAYELTSETSTGSQLTSEIEAKMSANELCNPVDITVDLVGKKDTFKGVTISYNSYMPYFGGKLDKKQFANLKIKVSYNGKVYDAAAGKIVLCQGKDETVSNASIQITKINATNKDEKKLQKELKKYTKATKKALGKMPIRIYAFRLSADTVSQLDLSKAKASGKEGKRKFSFKFPAGKGFGKKATVKEKKDVFGNKDKNKITVSQDGTLILSGNEIQGTLAKGKFTDKTK
jgi:hypothetical protein